MTVLVEVAESGDGLAEAVGVGVALIEPDETPVDAGVEEDGVAERAQEVTGSPDPEVRDTVAVDVADPAEEVAEGVGRGRRGAAVENRSVGAGAQIDEAAAERILHADQEVASAVAVHVADAVHRDGVVEGGAGSRHREEQGTVRAREDLRGAGDVRVQARGRADDHIRNPVAVDVAGRCDVGAEARVVFAALQDEEGVGLRCGDGAESAEGE